MPARKAYCKSGTVGLAAIGLMAPLVAGDQEPMTPMSTNTWSDDHKRRNFLSVSKGRTVEEETTPR